MPELDFKGKQHIYAHHLTVPYRPLVPDADPSRHSGDVRAEFGYVRGVKRGVPSGAEPIRPPGPSPYKYLFPVPCQKIGSREKPSWQFNPSTLKP